MDKILNFKQIDKLAYDIAEIAKDGTVIALIGDLGTGKTSFVKKIASKIGVTDIVKSPTFNYVIEYKSGKIPLYHFDVYRIDNPLEIYEIGYEDYLEKDGIVIIEWADIILEELPEEYICIKFFHNDEETRKINVEYIGDNNKNEEILKYVGFGD